MAGLERPPACPACQASLVQARTQTWDRVVTLQGEARLTLPTWACPAGHEWTPPLRAALRLGAHRQVALDVAVAVGVLRYGLDQDLATVQQDLQREGVGLSLGELSHLSDEFLVRYHHWFDASRPRWVAGLQRGLVLLIDGTSDGGGPVTYRVLVARHGITIHSETIPSENEEDLVRVLTKVRDLLGRPRLIVRDLSPAARAACTRVWPGVPQQGCWWHFLKDTGAALLEDAYSALRKALLDSKELAKAAALARRLAQPGALEGAPDAEAVRRFLRVGTRLALEHVLAARDDASGFPLRLAYHEVAARVRDLRRLLRDVVLAASTRNTCEPGLLEAKQRLDRLGEDATVREAFLRVDRRRAWFQEVRGLLGLDEAHTGRPGEPAPRADRETVLARVHGIGIEATQAGDAEAAAWERVVTRFDAHRDELWVQTRLAHPPRTTSELEVAHREIRRNTRKRTGCQRTGAEMERVGLHLAVWSNATQSWFVRHVLRGLDLEAEFAAQDPASIARGVAALRAKRYRGRLPVRDAARPALLNEFRALATGQATIAAMTEWTNRAEGVETRGV